MEKELIEFLISYIVLDFIILSFNRIKFQDFMVLVFKTALILSTFEVYVVYKK